jgi:hypothetical protein
MAGGRCGGDIVSSTVVNSVKGVKDATVTNVELCLDEMRGAIGKQACWQREVMTIGYTAAQVHTFVERKDPSQLCLISSCDVMLRCNLEYSVEALHVVGAEVECGCCCCCCCCTLYTTHCAHERDIPLWLCGHEVGQDVQMEAQA